MTKTQLQHYFARWDKLKDRRTVAREALSLLAMDLTAATAREVTTRALRAALREVKP